MRLRLKNELPTLQVMHTYEVRPRKDHRGGVGHLRPFSRVLRANTASKRKETNMKTIRTLIVAELLAVAIPSATAHIWSESMSALATDFNEECPGTKAWTDDGCAEKKKQAAARLLYYVDALNRGLWDACYSEKPDREYCAKYRKSIAAQRDWGLN
jgi:hypothetical protein